MYLLGYDVGSSSIKASLIDAKSGKLMHAATSPGKEMSMIAEQPGWAEQKPETWWKHVVITTREIMDKTGVAPEDVKALGISYQMHGLVLVDKNQNVLRPSIIWCDGRAVDIGRKAFNDLGDSFCLEHFLNSPGNFTASKLKWVKENEPGIYKKIHKFMLPGDYIAMKMSGEISTTISGLSEGILWDYPLHGLARRLLSYYDIDESLVPDFQPNFSDQGSLSATAAEELGLAPGTKIAYRAGDQPNNALSLNVLNPGEAAATAGTSGVIYGVTDKPVYDPKSRVNTFVHVNHTEDNPSYGVLLCVNGTGIQYSWIKNKLFDHNHSLSYEEMNDIAAQSPIGAEKLAVLPFGNGPERSLGDQNIGAQIKGIDFNQHELKHILRASQEGIAFALNYGLQIMKSMDMQIDTIRVGHANMFLSPVFAEAFTNATQARVELYETDGSRGAAIGSGIGAGIFDNRDEAFNGLSRIKTLEPDKEKSSSYQDAYQYWLEKLNEEVPK